MNKIMKWVTAFVAVTTSVSMADISLNFRHTTSQRETAGSGRTITFDFDVDGAGAVTLDATTDSTLQNIINSVNSWDGGVGSVTESSLFNTSFQIVMSSYSMTTANRSFMMEGRYDTGGIAISGNNASRIDGLDDDKEFLVFTLTSGSPLITLQSFDWDFASTTALLGDSLVKDGNSSVFYQNMSGTVGTLSYYGTQDTTGDGLTLGSGANALVFTTPTVADGFSHGISLAGLTLNVIPEPATIGLLGLGGIATVLARRFKNRA